MCLSCGTRGGEGAAAARTPEGPGLQGRDQRASRYPGDPALSQAEIRAGQGVCELSPRPLPAASHPLPNIRWPSVLGSGKEILEGKTSFGDTVDFQADCEFWGQSSGYFSRIRRRTA